MSDENNRRPSALWLCLLGAIVALFGAHVGRAWEFTVDDAGISFAYARNLAEGHGLVLTPGSERVEAPTNLLWVLLLTPAHWLHVSHEALAKVLGLVFGAGALVAIAFFPTAAYARRPRYYDLLAPAVAATFAHSALWTIAGLENGLYSFLTALSVTVVAWEEVSPVRIPWSAVALSLLFATRPDGALYIAAIVVAKALRIVTGKLTRQDVLWGLFLTLGVGSLELFRLAYFAWPLPNSFYTKQRVFDFGKDITDLESPGWTYVREWMTTYKLKHAMKLAPAVLLALRAPVARFALLFAVGAGIFLPVYSHGDWMEEWRFLTYFVPLLCLLLAESLRALVRLPLALLTPDARRWIAPGFFALAAVVLIKESTAHYPDRFSLIRRHNTLEFSTVQTRGRYFANAARALDLTTASVLDPDVGGMAYSSGMRVVDLFGLGDIAVAHSHGVNEPGLREAIFFERRPTFIHLHGLWFTASYLHRLEEIEQLYLTLPYSLGGILAEGTNYVRRETLAAPWTEESEHIAAPSPAEPWPEGFTRSADAIEPDEVLLVECAFARGNRLSAHELVAVPEGNGAAVVASMRVGDGVVDALDLHPGERPWARARLVLRNPGRYELRWRGNDVEVSLGHVTVGRGAGLRDLDAMIARLDGALRAGHLRDARSIALRLQLRARTRSTDARIPQALARYARALAEKAALLGDHDAFAVAVDMVRQAQRFAGDDAEVRALVQRVAERMADASRHAEQRRDVARAFTLARDAVLIDPRRSWMRRRAEELRLFRRGEYDGGRDLAAYRSAAAALSGSTDADAFHDRALTLLGSVSRWTEAAAMLDRTGRTPEAPWARLAAARGYLARGEVTEALRLAETVPCGEARDVDLTAAFKVLLGRTQRPTDALCEAPGHIPSDPPWLRADGPFDAWHGSFESGRFDGWTVTGNAFGPAPIHDKPEDQTFVNGWRGRYYASSFARNSDAPTGTLRSRPFTIGTEAISFLISGGADPEHVGVRLLVDGQAVRRTSGDNIEAMLREYWDVRPWRGRAAVIEVYDSAGEAWDHIAVDDFVAEPAMPSVLSRESEAPTREAAPGPASPRDDEPPEAEDATR